MAASFWLLASDQRDVRLTALRLPLRLQPFCPRLHLCMLDRLCGDLSIQPATPLLSPLGRIGTAV
jgi:hypothetical protein